MKEASARTIRNAHSQLVGLVIPDIQNDFYASVAKRVADTLAVLHHIRTVQLVRRNAGLDADAVTIDGRSGTFSAAHHLVQYGHRAIAYIGTTTMSSGRSRFNGFRQAIEQAGLDPSLTWLGPPRPEFARQAISLMLG